MNLYRAALATCSVAALAAALTMAEAAGVGGGVGPGGGIPNVTTVSGTLPVANGGTGAGTLTGILKGNGTSAVTACTTSSCIFGAISDENGSGGIVGDTGSTISLTLATGLPVSTGISGLGTGVATFLATPTSANLAATVTNETGTGLLVFATNPAFTTPDLGTPSAANLSNATLCAVSSCVSGLGTGAATFLGTPTSANFFAAITDENGTGAVAGTTNDVFVTPTLGDATATSIQSAIIRSGASVQTSNLYAAASNTAVANTSAILQINGVNTTSRAGAAGNSTTLITANANYAGFEIGNMPMTEAGSGTHSIIANFAVRPMTITNGAGTTTDIASIYVEAPPTGITPTDETLSLWIDTGASRLDGVLELPGIGASSAAQTGTLCWTTATGNVTVDTTTTCLLSLEEAKNISQYMDPLAALGEVLKLKPFWFSYKPGGSQTDLREHAGLGAHQVASVDKRLAGYDHNGKLQGVRYADSVVALNVAAIQGLNAKIERLAAANLVLTKRVATLERHHH